MTDHLMDRADRHPNTLSLLRWLRPNPSLPDGAPTMVAEQLYAAARRIVTEVDDGPELTAGLRKLLEAKDALVRAAIDSERECDR